MKVIVNGLLANYELQGKGRLVLLLHGWGDSGRGLSGLQQALAKNFKVLALDLPGFGDTQAPSEVWDLDNYAEFVRDFLKKVEIGESYAVVGHSNGGALAIRALSLGALQAQKLVLLAASGVRTSQAGKRLALKTVAKVGNVATVWLPESQRQKLRKSLYGVAGSDMLVVPELQETFKRTVRQDVQADAAKLTLPTLLIYAKGDAAVPVSDGQRYHELIKNSRLEIVNGAGHFVHQDQPDTVEKLVQEFLK